MYKPKGNFEGHYSSLRSAFTGSVTNPEGKKKRRKVLMETG